MSTFFDTPILLALSAAAATGAALSATTVAWLSQSTSASVVGRGASDNKESLDAKVANARKVLQAASPAPTKVKHVDEAALESDVCARFAYLCEFVGMGAAEVACVKGTAPYLAPLVPDIVNAVYNKLFSYDVTKRHFVPKQYGYDGAVPLSLSDLTLDHAQIRFRKDMLSKYLVTLVTGDYSSEKMVRYLDRVGKIHTPSAGSKSISVPLVQMDALMAFVADAVAAVVGALGLDREAERATQRAWGKLLWIQSDLIARHYNNAPATNPDGVVANGTGTAK